MPSVNTSGSQTATLTTEHTLATVATPGKFQLVVDAVNLTGSEQLELRIYGKAASGDSERLQYYASFVGAQTLDLKVSFDVPSPHHFKVTLEQTGGVGRVFPWAIYDVDDAPGVVEEASQTAVLTTEHELATLTNDGRYVLAVDTANLTGSEELELRIYGKARSADTERLEYYGKFVGGQTLDLKTSEEIGSPHHFRATLEQTNGTGRAFPWAIYDVGNPGLVMFHDLVGSTTLAAARKVGPVIGLTRASAAATYFDSSGVLQTAGANEARFDHDPSDNTPLGLWNENARTNELLRSEALDHADWGKAGAETVTANTTVAPDGNTTADTVEDTGGGVGGVFQTVSPGVDDSSIWTASVYVLKDNDETRFPEFTLRYEGSPDQDSSVQINTKTGASTIRVDSVGDTVVTVQDAGDYWRVIWTMSAGVSKTAITVILDAARGDTLGGNDWNADGPTTYWGAQLEEHNGATSYCKTEATSTTVDADVATIGDLSSLNASAGTIVVNASFPWANAAANALLTIDDGGTTDRLYLERDAAENINFATTHSADTDGASDGAGVIAINTLFKVAAAYADDDVIAYVDAASSGADGSAAFPLGDTLTTIRVGADSAGNYWDGHIEIIQIYDARKDNTFLTTETT